MDFGRVPESELPQVDFKLTKEPTWNTTFLKGKPVKSPKVYIGCAKWDRPEWAGKIYPPGTKKIAFLNEYVKHYNSIELNATHYKINNATAIKKWADKAKGVDFLFCPKIYKGISHYGKLTDKQDFTNSFLAGVSAFQKHLGPTFLQLSDRFSPKRKEELLQYLSSLPKDVSFFLEIRHPDWFQEPHFTELITGLKKSKTGFIITDTAGRRDCCHMHFTQNKAFIRYVGNSLHPTDYTRIDNWVKRIKYWLDNGLTELYFFMHMHDEATSPELTVYLVNKLNKVCKLNLKKPVFVQK